MAATKVKLPLPVDLTGLAWTSLRHDLKLEGYGIVWALLNRLAAAPGYSIPLHLVPTIAADMQVAERTVMEVITKYGIFQFDEHNMWYPELMPASKKQKASEPVLVSISKKDYTVKQIASHTAFNEFLRENCPRVSQMAKQMTIDEYLKMVQSFPRDAITKTLRQMENYKPLLTKYVSVYLTLINWTKNNGAAQELSEADKKLLSKRTGTS